MGTYLDHILAAHRDAAAADTRDLAELEDAARACPPTRGLRRALRQAPGVSVIAEIKRASPSKGPLALELDPARQAAAYEAGGAAAVSVLTDAQFFSGSASDLVRARQACSLPVLRKDFTVSEADVFDARIMGADALLLIVAALSRVELARLFALACGLGLDALVEVHDEGEAEVALETGATLIGVNQRDLYSFEVDTDRAVRVAKVLPEEVVKVAESGVSGPGCLPALVEAGFDAVLVGESLVRAPDPAAAVSALVRAGSG